MTKNNENELAAQFSVCGLMEHRTKFSELRELLTVAKKLRKAALDTSDNKYVMMFSRTADTLERHARMRAFGTSEDVEGSAAGDQSDTIDDQNAARS